MKIAVAQLGARMHYAVPRVFAQTGCLETLFTDLCASKGLGLMLRFLPQNSFSTTVKKLAARIALGVPRDKITTFDSLGFRYWRKLRQAGSRKDEALAHLWVGEEFGRLILKKGLAGADTLYTFNSAGLGLLRHARERGIRTVHEQAIVPVAIQVRLLMEEQQRWPDWEPVTNLDDFYMPFLENEKAEWQLADRILCGSQFVLDGLREAGGPADRAIVVPYGVDLPEQRPNSLDNKPVAGKAPLRVLIVGTVCLRKGAAYVAQAAERLGEKAEFRWAGLNELTDHGQAQLSQYVKLLGIVPRDQMPEHYRWADVFLLPSICEGSATVTYEALASGVPVVTTPNAGSPVRHGEDGFLVPIRDVEAICTALEQLLSKPDVRKKMSESARGHSKALSVQAYGMRLSEAARNSARQ